jgi:hypothetical protein
LCMCVNRGGCGCASSLIISHINISLIHTHTHTNTHIYTKVILPRMYYQRYCGVSEDEWDPFDLIKEGFQGAVGVFFTTWVLTFTVCHGNKMAGAGGAEGAGAA